MAVAVVENNLLIHELQLGEQLGECVHSKRRSDFSLMLAMLTDNVKEHSQFFVPETVQNPTETTDDLLRKEFNLPESAPLALKENEQLNHFDQSNLVQENRLTELHLLNALRPKALAFRDNIKHIAYDVLTNTSPYCQKKHLQEQQALSQSASPVITLNERLSFDAKGWLNNVQDSIVKSLLVTA
ncbi:MAG: hypothetical protein HRT38_07970 [Alteromonadaceae bacterium]|nr:hypothetical protein [Alteromonadaceae bacterium]